MQAIPLVCSAPRGHSSHPKRMTRGPVRTMVVLTFSLGLALGRRADAQSVDSGSLFRPLTLGPAPSQYRLASGAPGPKYWQNRADYDLQATIDTTNHRVKGSMVMRYTNNSPNTLKVLWMQTEQDPNQRISRFVQSVKGKFRPVTLENHNTETLVTLAEPIKPRTTTTFHVDWEFDLGPGMGGGRMGMDGSTYAIAQWFPRVNVYDDVKGWNTEPYTTGAEFFEEYGDYTLAVTVPANFIVAATGSLENPEEVLTATQRSRLALAAKSDTTVRIVTAAELSDGSAHPKKDGTLTWKFRSKNVRDEVFSASPEYQWDATSWHGILAQSFYRPSAATSWHNVADMLRFSVQEFSERWFSYPYPHISSAETAVVGMEYPMLSFDVDPVRAQMAQEGNSDELLFQIITHETGHNWFPMIVGSNERVHTWMDEGFNQFIQTFSEARRYPTQDQATRAISYIRSPVVNEIIENGKVIGNAGGQYFKTAGVLEMLRRDVMGSDAFDKGFRTYIQRWAYKHPTPVDFFRTMNEAAGRNLDWFWREWFLETPKFDQSIDSVAVTTSGNDTHMTVVYGNKQRGVMPLLVRVTFADDSTQDFTYPVDIWAKGSTHTQSYTFPGKKVARVTIDADSHLIDMNESNNVWRSSP